MSSSIIIIIFSYNRALQLDGVLQSFNLHCLDANLYKIKVLYKTSDEKFEQQYKKLSFEYSNNVEFIRESKFKENLVNIILHSYFNDSLGYKVNVNIIISMSRYLINYKKNFNNKFVLFLVDDTLFIKDFYLQDLIKDLECNNDSLGYSLRLGSNTRYCYTLNSNQKIPNFVDFSSNSYKYNWVNSEFDFAYPLEVSSSIYRVSDIMLIFLINSYKNPNSFEAEIAKSTSKFKTTKPFLLCPKNSIAFSYPINIVQSVFTNRVGKNEKYNIHSLFKKFEDGYRINVEYYSDFIPNSCHQEINLIFK